MSKVNTTRRSFEILKKRKRRESLHRLRELYWSAPSDKEEQRIVDQIRRLAPHLVPQSYLDIKKPQPKK